MPHAPTARIAVLANGDTVPLARAAAILGWLDSHLRNPDTEWEVPYHLRELCLGRPIEQEQERVLVQEGFVSRDGEVDPAVRAVVLSAVRGEGRVLRIDSPFTDADDRAIAEYLNGRNHIHSLSPAESAHLLADDRLDADIRDAVRPFDPPQELTDDDLDRLLKKLGLRRSPPRPPGSDLPPK